MNLQITLLLQVVICLIRALFFSFRFVSLENLCSFVFFSLLTLLLLAWVWYGVKITERWTHQPQQLRFSYKIYINGIKACARPPNHKSSSLNQKPIIYSYIINDAKFRAIVVFWYSLPFQCELQTTKIDSLELNLVFFFVFAPMIPHIMYTL